MEAFEEAVWEGPVERAALRRFARRPFSVMEHGRYR